MDTQPAPQGHTVTPPEPKQWERQQPQAISTPLLLVELPFSSLITINVPEPLALGLIDCLIEKVNILAQQWCPLPTISSRPSHLLEEENESSKADQLLLQILILFIMLNLFSNV